jgi:nucleoside-diphosphate-sugar epimerase
MNILIVGASSFIGKNLIPKLPGHWNIFATYNTSESFKEFIKEYKNVEAIKLDLTKSKIPKFNKIDVILYLVGISPGIDDGSEIDGMSQMDFLHAKAVSLIVENVKGFSKFIYFSSGIYYLLNNFSSYRKSRMLGEAMVSLTAQSNKFDYLIIRNMEIYGDYMPKHKIYRKICESALNNDGELNFMGDGNNFVDTMYIDDYIEIIVSILNLDVKNKTLDVCKSEPVTIKDLVNKIYQVVGKDKPIVNFEGTPSENTNFTLSNREMVKTLGFEPKTSLKSGLKKWIKNGLK